MAKREDCGQSEGWERSLEVLHEDQAIDVVGKALAGAFGLSSSMSIPLVRRHEEEAGGTGYRTASLSVFRRGTVQQSANGYLPESPAEREQVLARLKPTERATVLEFDRAACMRLPGSANRTRQIRSWKASAAIVAVPSVRPSRTALNALVDARLDVPLEAWLLLYATGQTNHWAVVARYMEACGHPNWAAREAALRITGTRRPFRDVAREVATREARCRSEITAAERRLMDWLARASRRVAAAMGTLIE